MNWTSDHSIQYLKSNPMNKKVKIAYCIPSLYYPSGMERVLTLKANYFAEHLGYDIHIILTDGKGKEPYYKLYPSITTHQLDSKKFRRDLSEERKSVFRSTIFPMDTALLKEIGRAHV